MEYSQSKKSSIRDNAVVYEVLDRGHQSEITRVKKPDKATTASGRRMFTFMGSASGKQQRAQGVPQARPRTPTKSSTPRTRTPHSKRIPPRSRSHSIVKHKPSSIKRLSDTHNRSSRSRLSESKDPPTKLKRDQSLVSRLSENKERERASRSASVIGKQTSRSSSANSKKSREIIPDDARKSRSGTPITIDLPTPAQPSETISPAILVGDDRKIETKDEPMSPILPSISSSDEDNKADEEEISTSPSMVGYRKLVYSEKDDKWIEHWKIEEDMKRVQKKATAQKLLKKWEAEKNPPKVHPVKGRITTKVQVMFPTAIVKQDRRHGGTLYQSILMTDPLRIELHKRRAPIVPTYYQEHIAKFGKLPFRNNPRPHPIV